MVQGSNHLKICCFDRWQHNPQRDWGPKQRAGRGPSLGDRRAKGLQKAEERRAKRKNEEQVRECSVCVCVCVKTKLFSRVRLLGVSANPPSVSAILFCKSNTLLARPPPPQKLTVNCCLYFCFQDAEEATAPKINKSNSADES